MWALGSVTRSRSKTEHSGRWGYVLEAGGKATNIFIQDYTRADPAWLAQQQAGLDRRVAEGRLRLEAPGRYVRGGPPDTWAVKGDHIVIWGSRPLPGGARLSARLSPDGKSLQLGFDRGGTTWVHTGDELHKQ